MGELGVHTFAMHRMPGYTAVWRFGEKVSRGNGQGSLEVVERGGATAPPASPARAAEWSGWRARTPFLIAREPTAPWGSGHQLPPRAGAAGRR
jgi:hypothetical protein